MEENKARTREEALAPVIAKAWQDEAFMRELITNPKAVIQKEFGLELPANVDVNVLQETPDKLFIVIPNNPTGELSDEQLEAVAGGFCAPALVFLGAAALGLGIAQGQRRGW